MEEAANDAKHRQRFFLKLRSYLGLELYRFLLLSFGSFRAEGSFTLLSIFRHLSFMNTQYYKTGFSFSNDIFAITNYRTIGCNIVWKYWSCYNIDCR